MSPPIPCLGTGRFGTDTPTETKDWPCPSAGTATAKSISQKTFRYVNLEGAINDLSLFPDTRFENAKEQVIRETPRS